MVDSYLNSSGKEVAASPTNPKPAAIYDVGGNPIDFSGTASVILTSDYPSGATAVNASSGNLANTAGAATLPAVSGKINYIAGFTVHGGGAMAASLQDVTVTGLNGGTMTYTLGVVAGATAANVALSVSFKPPIPASAANTAIAVNVPALGFGNTKCTINAYGYYK